MWGRYRRWPRAKPLLGVAVLLILSGVVYVRSAKHRGVSRGAYSEPVAVLRAGPGEVVAVLSADTLLVKQASMESSGQEFLGPVRLLGIGVPAVVAREALAFTQQAVASGSLRLELEKRRLDREGRFFAYVYVDQQQLSEELVAAGLARVHTYPGDSMTINRQLLRAEDQARIEQVGLWSPEFTADQRTAQVDD